MHICILDDMYVCSHRALLVCALFSRRTCSQAAPPPRTSLRLLVIARISFMHVRVLDTRYVRFHRF